VEAVTPEQCAFCKEQFYDHPKCTRVAREATLRSLESAMCLSVWNMFQRDPTLLQVIASLSGGPHRCLCNYCHTRVTVSRDAAEAL